jgi:DNA-binding response OmpR family regulator
MEVRMQLADVLRSHAIIVETSARDEALTAMRGRLLDGAFIDIDRTDESGLNIAVRLRRATARRRVRLIAVSSTYTTSDAAVVRGAGFDLRVGWPLEPEQVLAALNTIRTSQG